MIVYVALVFKIDDTIDDKPSWDPTPTLDFGQTLDFGLWTLDSNINVCWNN
jgi:hypothetical protein